MQHRTAMEERSSSPPGEVKAPPQPDAIWIIDADGKTVFANESMAQILGTTTTQMSGQDSFLYIFPEDVPAAQRLFASKQSGSSASFHFRLRRVDGNSVWVNVQGTPMHNAAGEFLGVVGTFTLRNVEEWQELAMRSTQQQSPRPKPRASFGSNPQSQNRDQGPPVSSSSNTGMADSSE
jgi:PAS domain S-box-containing protein